MLRSSFQQTQQTVHKLLGARLYDARAKRPKLKATDRRPTVDVTATSSDDSTNDDSVKPPQTIDEIRRLRSRRSRNAQPVLKPYVGRRTTGGVVRDEAVCESNRLSEDCASAAEAGSPSHCNVPTSDSRVSGTTADTDVRTVNYHSSGHSSRLEASTSQTNETVQSVDANSCLPKEKLSQYLHAVG